MKLKIWQIDAFAERPLGGNPAAIVPLTSWLDDALLQAIACENNLAETAFILARGAGDYELRWFTPTMEVPLCGHATLASAWLIFSELEPQLNEIQFSTRRSGVLSVTRGEGGWHRMRFPSGTSENVTAPEGVAEKLGACVGADAPDELFSAPKGAAGTPGLLAVWAENSVRAMRLTGPLQNLLSDLGFGALLATAKADAPYDFVSRFFAPGMGVPEDPVTGSAHCTLAPFWAERLGKKELFARQVSPRGGSVRCIDDGPSTILSGQCALYMRGEIELS